MQHILVCDDEKDIVAALKIYLESDGYCVHTAYSGEEALRVAKTEPVQLALMDIMMPGMDGITAMAKLREFSNIPVILLTAKSEDSDKILGLSVGADDYITKPFNPVEVLAVGADGRRHCTRPRCQARHARRRGDRADAKGIRHFILSHAAPRQGLHACGTLQRRVERSAGRH